MSDKSTLFPTVQDSDEAPEEWKRSQNETSDEYSSKNQRDVNREKERQEANNLTQYKKKITPDGRIVRVLLSDGETSSGIDSVSSIDVVDDVASDDMNAFMKNVFVEVKNEIAVQNIEGEKFQTLKKINQQVNGSDGNDDKMDLVDSPPHGGVEEEFRENANESRNGSEQQQNKHEEPKKIEVRTLSSKSEERISRILRRARRSRRSKSSRNSKKRSSKRLHSRDRSRSVSRSRRWSSQERKSKYSKRRLSRSLSRERSRSLTRKRSRSLSRRSRSLTKRRPTSLSRKRSRSSSKPKMFARRRSRSLSRRRSNSPIRRSRSLSRRRSRSLSRRRSRSLSRRRSRSLSRKRSKSPIRRSRSLSRRRSRSLSRRRCKSPIRRSRSLVRRRSRSPTKKSSSRKRSRSYEKVSSTSSENRESGIRDRDSSISYYSVTQSRRKRGDRDYGFQSTTIQVSGYFPPVIGPRYYWRGINRYPRIPGRGSFYPSIKRPYTPLYDVEDSTPALKAKKQSDVQSFKSSSPDNSSKDSSPKVESKQDEAETVSESSSRSSSDDVKICTDTEERPLPRVPDSTGCGSLDDPKHRTPFPTVGLDCRPLVRGPTGLPVHISPTGVTIPYDMDGRRIPIGPNGHYLPLDVSGRLFPHVITPGNNAVPIYISEDGVLRLPDSRPVPFGFPHKLPVNIDGKMILMGPDSRPLVPCPNLPVRPPVMLDQVSSSKFEAQKPKVESPQSETNQVVDSSGIEIVDLDLIDDLDENKNIDSKRNEPNSSCNTQKKPDVVESTMNPLSTICAAPNIKEILDSVDENLLKKVKELTQHQNKVVKKKPELEEDPIVIRIRSVIKSLVETNYEPPQLGRFYVSEVLFEPEESDLDFDLQSPLLRNRVKLPFITPKEIEISLSPPESPETDITYTFASKGNFNASEEKIAEETCVYIDDDSSESDECLNKPKTTEIGVQCKLEGETMDDSHPTVSKLKKELGSIQKAYSTLFDMYEKVLGSKAEALENEV